MYARLILIFATLFFSGHLAVAQTITVAVAANMKDAFGEIAQEFKEKHRSQLRVVYGSSGNFAAQIQNGAPFALFIAVDEHFPLGLYKSGKTVNEGSVYAIGKLVLLAKSNAGFELAEGKTEMLTQFKERNVLRLPSRISLRMAKQLWRSISKRRVFGSWRRINWSMATISEWQVPMCLRALQTLDLLRYHWQKLQRLLKTPAMHW
jgi:hypothetical protein